jgi:hypothetical protein
MPKPSWLTLVLKLIGFAGRVATDANQAFPNAGHRVPVQQEKVVKLVTKARRRKVGKDVTRLDEQ